MQENRNISAEGNKVSQGAIMIAFAAGFVLGRISRAILRFSESS